MFLLWLDLLIKVRNNFGVKLKSVNLWNTSSKTPFANTIFVRPIYAKQKGNGLLAEKFKDLLANFEASLRAQDVFLLP